METQEEGPKESPRSIIRELTVSDIENVSLESTERSGKPKVKFDPGIDDGNHDSVGSEDGRILDGFLMLAAGGSAEPQDVISVNLSSLELIKIQAEDMAYFENVCKLDASDNRLQAPDLLVQLDGLPRLSNLSLACNSIFEIKVPQRILANLESLDLSFNHLDDVLAQLIPLRKLKQLNLSSNFITSIKPNKRYNEFEALEEVILDKNDLSNFSSWRALDALPKLRKLSLQSNCIKRLKEDDEANGEDDKRKLFSHLEELDLSSNYIKKVNLLPVLLKMQTLKVLRLEGNPLSSDQRGSQSQRIDGVKILSDDRHKQRYPGASGCVLAKLYPKEPRLKLNRKTLRRVRTIPALDGTRHMQRKKPAPLCAYEEETNRLLVFLQDTPVQRAQSPSAISGIIGAHLEIAQSTPILDDELPEEELDRIFAERRAKIEEKFNSSAEDPPSFMRPTPFSTTASEAPNKKLGLQLVEDATQDRNQLFSLTGVADEGTAFTPGQTLETPVSTFASKPTTPGNVTLPPIIASKSSSAHGSRSATPNKAGTLGEMTMSSSIPIGVREAMRAIRTAALSDYAVAAW